MADRLEYDIKAIRDYESRSRVNTNQALRYVKNYINLAPAIHLVVFRQPEAENALANLNI